MKRLAFLIGVLALVAAACGESTHPDVTAPRDAASVELGKMVFADACAECHGENLEGATNDEGVEGPELVSHGLGHPDSDFIEFVRDGKGSDMPALGGELSTEEIAAVIDYVRSIQGANVGE